MISGRAIREAGRELTADLPGGEVSALTSIKATGSPGGHHLARTMGRVTRDGNQDEDEGTAARRSVSAYRTRSGCLSDDNIHLGPRGCDDHVLAHDGGGCADDDRLRRVEQRPLVLALRQTRECVIAVPAVHSGSLVCVPADLCWSRPMARRICRLAGLWWPGRTRAKRGVPWQTLCR